MTGQSEIQWMKIAAVDSFCSQLLCDGFVVFSIGKPANSFDFFRQVKEAYPLDPELSGNVHWDAFSDSIWGGLDACKESKIALVVRNITDFDQTNHEDCHIALTAMAEAAASVKASKRLGGARDAEILVAVGLG